MNKKYVSLILALTVMGGSALITPTLAIANQQGGGDRQGENKTINSGQTPVVVGTVSAINDNTITVAEKQDKNTSAIFTVDAAKAKITKNGVTIAVSNIAVGDNIAVQGTITGTNIVATIIRDGKDGKGDQGEMDSGKMMPVAVGKVSAINGNTLTIISKQGLNKTASDVTTTFTVDVTNAKLLRGNTVITLSDIAVGDNIAVQGTITGTNIVATIIRDGKIGNGNEGDNNQALLQIQGNGQPIVAGTISAINGSTITITNNSNVTYTINATDAKIIQGKNVISLSAVKTGDSVIVQGVVNGTSVTASTIIDQAKPVSTTVGQNKRTGFFGSIGQFFKHLFGF